MVAYSLASSQCPPCAVLVLVFLRFVSAAQLVLVLVLFQKLIRSWKLVADVTHLLFSHMLLFQFVFILSHGSLHVDLECQILALGSEI